MVAGWTRAHPVTWRRAVVLVVATAGMLLSSLLLTPEPALAHASLVGTDPADGERLEAAPATVTLTFDEPVEVPTGALRVYDADARRVDDGAVESGDDARVAVALPDDLPDGGYVVTYRVVSTDDHPIGGVTAFTVGGGAAVDATTVEELAAGAGDGPARPAGMLLRGLGYLATLLAGGAALHAVVVARRRVDRRAARDVGTVAAGIGALLALLSVPVQAMAVSGQGVAAAVGPATLEVVGSSFGLGALVRAAALAWLLVLWRLRVGTAAPAVAGVVAVVSFVLDGHQRSVDPTWLLVGGDVAHLLAGASWFAGLVLLTLALRRAAPDDDPVEVAGLVARFSTVALLSAGLVAVAGVAMSVPLVGTIGALTSTTYGWLLVGKVTAVAVVLVLAAYNRQRLVPAIVALAAPAGGSVDAPAASDATRRSRGRAAWGQLRRTTGIEAGVLTLVLLLTGVLVTVQPAAEAAGLGGLYETTATLDDGLEVDLVVDPNRVGSNAIHLYVLDASGRPSDEVEDVMLELTYLPEDIGPIPIEPFTAGPGHWVANSDAFVFDGDWEVRVVAGTDRFTESNTTLTVPVAP